VKRRAFITLIGGAAAAWPLAARAQPTNRPRRVGVLQGQPESDADFRSWRMLFAARLRELGWTDGENLQIDYRYGAGDAASIAPVAKELVNLHPDALFAITALSAVALRRSYPKRGEAERPACPAADQVRAGHQPQNRQDARPLRADLAARPSRRGDRVKRPRRDWRE